MSELLDEIKEAFNEDKEQFVDDDNPVQIAHGVDLPPGTVGMKNYSEHVMLVVTRRIYRWFAGSTAPLTSSELLKTTGTRMVGPLSNAVMEAFAAGVLIGHRSEHLVRLAHHVHMVDELFADQEFQTMARTMATGFREDAEIQEFFATYISGAAEYLSHITGFAHHEQLDKVWDVWMICGVSGTNAAYMAGYRMGTSWYERDVLDGILIATEEITHGPEEADARDR